MVQYLTMTLIYHIIVHFKFIVTHCHHFADVCSTATAAVVQPRPAAGPQITITYTAGQGLFIVKFSSCHSATRAAVAVSDRHCDSHKPEPHG